MFCLCVYTMAFTGDMKQQSDNSGFGSVLGNRGCSKCYMKKNKNECLMQHAYGSPRASQYKPSTPCGHTKETQERRERREAEEKKEKKNVKVRKERREA